MARLGREILAQLGNPGADWVKLEVLGDKKTLLPDPIATLEATETLVAEGFQVLVYTSDDPVMARRLKEAGATSVMPAGSPIGSGQGVLNPNAIRICLEYLKDGDPDYPVIVDAGVGTASDVTVAMELGVDGVLLNTGIAHAKDPLRMARAMRLAAESGRLAYLAGRIPKKLYATASSPTEGRRSRPSGYLFTGDRRMSLQVQLDREALEDSAADGVSGSFRSSAPHCGRISARRATWTFW